MKLRFQTQTMEQFVIAVEIERIKLFSENILLQGVWGNWTPCLSGSDTELLILWESQTRSEEPWKNSYKGDVSFQGKSR